jgi:hypothetical protein
MVIFHSYVSLPEGMCKFPYKTTVSGVVFTIGGMDLWTLSPHSAFLFARLPGM